MDKYEYKLKLEQIKKLAEVKDYKGSAQIADSVNWKKVKSVATLCMIGEIYEKNRQLEESREILLMAYDRSPVGRNIIYRLTLVALKLGNLQEAQDYYEEFLEIAPHDNMKYVLKYEIAKAKGTELEEQISILEEFKEREYTEEWAFELAYLYHKAGKEEKCVDICDELILWFGEGQYVEKALELKMMYQPLNKLQEDKYRRFKQKKEGIVEVSPYDELSSGEIVSETVQIPSILSDTGKFNTVNLQEELAKSMEQIMNATKQETVSDTMENIKKMVGGIPYLEPEEMEELKEPEDYLDEPEEDFTGEIPDPTLQIDFQDMRSDFPQEPESDSAYQGILAEEYDGQFRLRIPDTPSPNLQITGQMSIEDILAEWERAKEAARAAIAEAEQRQLDDAKAKALREAQSIMERLTAEIRLNPELLEQSAGRRAEIGGNSDAQKRGPGRDLIFPGQEASGFPDSPMGRNPEPEYGEVSELEQEQMFENNPETGGFPGQAPNLPDGADALGQESGSVSDGMGYPDQETGTVPEGTDGSAGQEASAETSPVLRPGAELKQKQKELERKQKELEQKILRRQQLAQQVLERPATDSAVNRRRTGRLPSAEALGQARMEGQTSQKPVLELNEEQKKIFTYFTCISGMEEQLCRALEGVRQKKKGSRTSQAGNLMILGGKGSGKTMLATNFVKAYQKLVGHTGGKVGKISAVTLNQKDAKALLKAVEGGYLIIEKAGDLSKESVEKLSELMELDTKGVMVLLEDDRTGMERAMRKSASFAEKFTEKIEVPIFTSDELVEFAKAYAREQNCVIDDMGILALYNSISNIQKLDEATTLTEVKDIMDGAISRAGRGGLKKLFGGKRSTENGHVLIKEKDFQE